MKYKYVIFDVGGTLLRWGDSLLFTNFLRDHAIGDSTSQLTADAAALRRLMIETFNRQRHAAVGMGATGQSVVEFWRRALGETLELWQRPGYRNDILEPLTSAVLNGEFDAPFDDAIDTLRRLRSAGYRLGVISNWNENLPNELAGWGLDRFFDFVIVSSLVGVAKPSPEIFRLGLQKAGCQPHEALYVGDNLIDDCHGARAAGLDAALIRRGGDGDKDATLAPCTTVYRSLTALADALLKGDSQPPPVAAGGPAPG